MNFYKKPESLYNADGTLIRTVNNRLNGLVLPIEGPAAEYGLEIGSIKGPTLVCEDSVLFKQDMSYSLGVKTAGADVLVYRFPASDVL